MDDSDMQRYDYDQALVRQAMSVPYQTPMRNQDSSIIMLTNPAGDMVKMQSDLLGLEYDEEGNAIQRGEALMNWKGVKAIMSSTRSFVNQIGVMTNFEEKVINPLILDFVWGLGEELGTKWYDYGIDARTRNVIRSKIVKIARNYAYITILRAKNEGERRFWKGTSQEIITRGQRDTKPNMLQKMTNWK